MGLKFNGGCGAYTCDQCNVIVFENPIDYEWNALIQYETKYGEWFCEECCPNCQKEQFDRYLDIIHENAPKYMEKQRAYIKTLCDDNIIL